MFNVFTLSSIFVLSIFLYIGYLFFADTISIFEIYRTARVVLSSAQYYLIFVFTVGFSILTDVFYILYIREYKTPLYVLFNSLTKSKLKPYKEKKEMFEKISFGIKNGYFEL